MYALRMTQAKHTTTGGGERIESLDIYRGAAILAVVAIHVFGHFLHVVTVNSRAWIALAFTNRALQFAVPAFLLLSALLNLRPLLDGRPLGAWMGRRLQRALWPYVVWSLIFLLIARWGRLETLTPALVWNRLLTGNAYYHLYFLLLIAQMYLLLPLVAPLFRRRPPFWAVAVVALALQGGVYYANRRWLLVSEPGSVIFWYLPSVSLGCWLATRREDLRGIVPRGLWPALAVAAAMLAVHGPLAMALMRKQPLDTLAYQASLSVYAAAASFALLGVSASPLPGIAAEGLKRLGARSLEVYIAHPIAILLLDAWLHFPPRLPLAAAIVLYLAVCLLLPLGFAWLLQRAGLSRWVWGVEGRRA